MAKDTYRRRPCGCHGHAPGHRPGHDRPCPCPCGWRSRPEDCDRLYDECRWCGLSQEECDRKLAECERKWEDWPFYRGPCPGGPDCSSFCTCKPVSAVHGLLTRTDALDLKAGDFVPFSGEYVESDCMVRVRSGLRTITAGTFLVTVTVDLPSGVGGRLYVTVDREEVPGGGLTLWAGNEPVHATLQTIVTADADSVIGLAAANDMDFGGCEMHIAMCAVRIA